MNVKTISEDNEKLVFEMDADATFANVLRREVLENVPSMAINYVEIRQNGSALYDEIIAHRLGLVPLKTDLSSYEMPGEEESLKTHLKLTLKAKGPCTVYASDLKSKDPKVVPVFGDMPITKLLKGQELELEATATLGTGKEHMKWAPGYAFYTHAYKFNQKKAIDDAEDVVKKCPAGVFKAEKGKLVPLDESKGYLWDTCLPHVPEGTVEIVDENKIIFTIESWGQLSPKEVLVEAGNSLKNEVEILEKVMK